MNFKEIVMKKHTVKMLSLALALVMYAWSGSRKKKKTEES